MDSNGSTSTYSYSYDYYDDEEGDIYGIQTTFAFKVVIFFCYGVILFAGCVFNIVMLVVGIRHHIVGRNANLPKQGSQAAQQQQATFNVTNILVTNLAVADIFLCLFAVVFTPVAFYIENWPFGEFGCKFLPSTSVVAVCVISFTSTVIALDRLLAICHPHSRRLTFCSALISLVIVWVVSVCLSIPVVVNSKTETEYDFTHCIETWDNDVFRRAYSFGILIIQFLIPAFVISYCYIRIGFQLQKRTTNGPSVQKAVTFRSGNTAAAELKRTVRTIRILVSMSAVFMICWLPIDVLQLFADLGQVNVWLTYPWYAPAFLITHIIAMSCTLWNPLLYGWMNGRLRLKIIAIISPQRRNETIAPPLREISDNNVKFLVRANSQSENKADESNDDLMPMTGVPKLDLLTTNTTTITGDENDNYSDNKEILNNCPHPDESVSRCDDFFKKKAPFAVPEVITYDDLTVL